MSDFHKITGIIYDKPTYQGTKKDGTPYERKSIVLEVKRETKQGAASDLLEFMLGFSANDNGFDIGQKIEMSFSIGGRKWKDKYYSTLYAKYVKHPDIQSGVGRDVEGEPEWKKKEEVFVAPDPYDDEELDMQNLPF